MPNKTDIDPLSITDGKISNLANINPKKLAKATEGQVLVAQADGRFAAKSLSGDVSLQASGAATVTSVVTAEGGGTTTVVTGPAGQTGAQGQVGAQGAQGPAGSDATVTTSAVDSAGAVMETDLVQTSAGAGDASKPIKLDSTGKIDASMIDDGDISYNNIADVPSAFAPSSHNHDDRYYTETETDTLLAAKAASSHNHDTAYLGITAKAADSDKLDGQDSTAFAAASHTHTLSNITDAGTAAAAATGDFAASGHNHNSTYLGITAQAADSDMLDGLHGGDFAAADHGHTAADVTDGTFANARISAASVTQHQASIDHDALTNFVANEHINWTADQGATNIHTGNYNNTEYTAGTGLSLSGTEFSYDNTVIASQVNLSDGLALYTPLSTYQGHGHGQYAVKANNLSDLTNAGTARTNLGLGTAAQSATGDFAASGHTHTAATPSANGFMSSTDKTKLNGVQDGAEVNVQSDWNASSGDAQILNKPTVQYTSAIATGNNGLVPAAGSSGQFLAHDGTFQTPSGSSLTNEQVQDIVGAMFTGNTETNISATYQDADGTIDLAVENYPSKYTAQITFGGGAQGTNVDFTLTTGSGTVTHNGYILNHNLGTQSFVASVRTPYDPADGNSDDQTPDTWNDAFNHLYWQHMDVGFDGASITNNSVLISTVNKNSSNLPELSDNHCAIAIPVDADDDPTRIYLVTLIG